MDRLDVIKALMTQKELKNYLEIGVENGHVFFRLKSNFKTAVDPKFIFDFARKIGKIVVNPYNIFNRYYEKTSDDFFKYDAEKVFANKKIQLALIDGMHEFQFALRDVENTLKYLDQNGVIIMHDCNPQSANAAGPFDEWTEGQWNGDVWKTIVYLRSARPDLTIFVLDCDQGLGIISRKKTADLLNFNADEISGLTYQDLYSNRKKYLNLKPKSYFFEFFNISSELK